MRRAGDIQRRISLATVVTAVLTAAAFPVAPAAGAPAPGAPLPSTAPGLATALERTDAALHATVRAWLAPGTAAERGATPPDVTLWALREQRIYRRLRADDRLAGAVLPRLPGPLRAEAWDVVTAGRELLALARGTPPNPHPPRPAPALPAGVLRGYYLEAQRRFAVPWTVLAAVNQVETDYGRLQNASAAGAQGPMQFLPATWRRYGLGGDVHDPHDAILGAANYLHASGAPGDVAGALYHYNPSHGYVDAVLRYARVMRRDPLAYPGLHSWQAYVRTAHGARRLTGPGTPVPSTRR